MATKPLGIEAKSVALENWKQLEFIQLVQFGSFQVGRWIASGTKNFPFANATWLPPPSADIDHNAPSDENAPFPPPPTALKIPSPYATLTRFREMGRSC